MNLAPMKSTRHRAGQFLIQLEDVSSTNTWLLEQAQLLDLDGLVVTARRQHQGRGRLGRSWEAGQEGNLICSMTLHAQGLGGFLPSLTLLLGLAIHRALCGLGAKGLGVKWPNDLLWQQKKLCGILCELKQHQGQPVVVAGFGVNLVGRAEQFSPELQERVTTLEEITGKLFQPLEVLESILNQWDAVLAQLQSGQAARLFGEWEQSSLSLGRAISFEEGGQKKTGVILGLDTQGSLRIKDQAGQEKTLLSGEILFL